MIPPRHEESWGIKSNLLWLQNSMNQGQNSSLHLGVSAFPQLK
jgi:hypothetical protein